MSESPPTCCGTKTGEAVWSFSCTRRASYASPLGKSGTCASVPKSESCCAGGRPRRAIKTAVLRQLVSDVGLVWRDRYVK